MSMRTTLIFSALLTLTLPASPARGQGNPDWHREIPGFKIAGNLYYVGTADLAVYLVNTPQGNILINSDFKEDVPAIKKAIAQLGFKYADTKIILISHAHGDHDEATGVMQKETGAKLMVMEGDVADEQSTAPGRPGAHVDRTLHDGDTVELGGTKLVAHLTPGHTHGCTTWTMKAEEGGKSYDVAIIGSMGINSDTTQMWSNGALTPLGEEYTRGFKAMHEIHADVVLGSHPAMHGLAEKYAKLKAGSEANPYIDPKGYETELAIEEGAFKLIIENQKKAEAAARPGASN